MNYSRLDSGFEYGYTTDRKAKDQDCVKILQYAFVY